MTALQPLQIAANCDGCLASDCGRGDEPFGRFPQAVSEHGCRIPPHRASQEAPRPVWSLSRGSWGLTVCPQQVPVPGQYDGARGWVCLCPVSPAAAELGSCSVSTTSDGLLATERQSL